MQRTAAGSPITRRTALRSGVRWNGSRRGIGIVRLACGPLWRTTGYRCRRRSESALSAFLGLVLRQTVPADLQDEVLRRLQVEQRRGGVGGGTLAIFTDQLRMLRDEPQLYGTQLLMDLETGFLRPYPIEDDEGVDERRRELGLGPFADYLRRMRARVDGS
jgi:hypothetical protein